MNTFKHLRTLAISGQMRPALLAGVFLTGFAVVGPMAADGPQCVDYSKDPAGCQPSTFKTPMAQMPTVRVNRQGVVDPTSSEEDARAGAAKLEKDLHLARNFEPLHWVLTVPSVKDPATGAWKGGDLDGAGDDVPWLGFDSQNDILFLSYGDERLQGDPEIAPCLG